MPKEFQPLLPKGPDPKWRYMWRVGPRPSNTRFKVLNLFYTLFSPVSRVYPLQIFIPFVQELNSEPVIPEGFPEWKDTMDSWGFKMISAIEVK